VGKNLEQMAIDMMSLACNELHVISSLLQFDTEIIGRLFWLATRI